MALILAALASAAMGQDQPVETRGAWRIVADGPDFALRTQALDAPGNTLALFCRKEQRRYAFEIRSPALATRPSDEETRIGFKVDEDDQVWLRLASGPDGTVPIAHETAFLIIQAALMRDGAKGVAFTVHDHTWQFALDGFAGLRDSLTAHCGFEFEPTAPKPRPRGSPLSR